VIISDWSAVQTTDFQVQETKFEVQEQKYEDPVTYGLSLEENMDDVDLEDGEDEKKDGKFI